MTRFLEIRLKETSEDFRGRALADKLSKYMGLKVSAIRTGRIYAFDMELEESSWEKVFSEFIDPVIEERIYTHDNDAFDYVMRVGFNPGVTDNEGRTAAGMAKDIAGDALKPGGEVYTSRLYLFRAPGISGKEIEKAAYGLVANRLIETADVYTMEQWKAAAEYPVPKIEAEDDIAVETVDLAGLDDAMLERISLEKMLALTASEMRAISDYFDAPETAAIRLKKGFPEKPTDAELEILAQTWSEHCKHKIFASSVNYDDGSGNIEESNSLYKTYIKVPTREIMEKTGHIVSVFDDNSGVMRFNKKNHVCYKVETHNSPSALDPYGGAMTGIVGVNRDILGTGRGAVPHANVWGYCFADPDRREETPAGLMHPRRIREGVHRGVIDGGNQSGIPYARGWELFDERYLGKPLVYCGTVGILPAMLQGYDGSEKKALPGDLVVMTGGRIGKDGIHGATFSSRELDESSPVQAVQIGDPITQKKMTDFIIEARDLGLFNAITDNGAGGLASSVGEMARDTGGVFMDLSKAPLKYPGLQPWEILISEAQERMTLAVSEERIDAFMELAELRDVEAAVLGRFTDSGFFHAVHGDRNVCFIEMDFLHDGLPEMTLDAVWEDREQPSVHEDSADTAKEMLRLLSSPALSSKEAVVRAYDHEVKGLSVMKPLTGIKADVMGDASIMGVEYGSAEGIVLTEAVNPWFSDIDTYHMTASIVDEAVRKAVAAGADPGHMAVLDNFCWPDPVFDRAGNPDGKYKMAQLVRSCKALAEYTRAYLTPCISGKDSMKNDARLEGKKISIPPTLLISLIAKIEDFSKAVFMSPGSPGDDIYIAGTTFPEHGGSEYSRMKGLGRGLVPRVRAQENLALYGTYHDCVEKGLVKSAHSPSKGGVAASLMLQCMAGRLGMDIDISALPAEGPAGPTDTLFSESNGRIIFTAESKDRELLKDAFAGTAFSRIGSVTGNESLHITDGKKEIADIRISDMLDHYKGRLNEI